MNLTVDMMIEGLSYIEVMTWASVGFFPGGGALRDFSKIFLGWAKSGEICFFPLKTKKTTFFNNNFKIQGASKAPWPPSEAHAR